MAFAGLHPVFAVYATFLNRAFDQVIMDCALHKAGVTFVLDRAGVTGDDGASHNGMWDLALLRIVPGLRVAAPRDADTLRRALRAAVAVNDGPTVVRFPKGALGPDLPALRSIGAVDVLYDAPEPSVLIVGIGVGSGLAVQVAEKLSAQGIAALVVDPVWVQPISQDLLGLTRNRSLVVTIEDGIRSGGVGDALQSAMRDAGITTPCAVHGLPTTFFDHGSRSDILSRVGMTAADIARDLSGKLSLPAHELQRVFELD
jgi:1-deoxy-D-xylulose-5-phosphate synthase